MKEKTLAHFVEWKKVADAELEATLHDVRSWGVTDIVAHPVWGLRNQREKGYLEKIARLIVAAGLRSPACHAFWGAPFDLALVDEQRRRQAMLEHCDFLCSLAPMGVKTYTLHLGIEENCDSDLAWGQIRKSVDQLLSTAEANSIVLALENGGESIADIQRLAALVKEYDHPQLGICFDSGHANCHPEIGLLPTLELLKPAVVTTHLHDNHGAFDDHNPPGDGTINWKELLPVLKACPRLLHAETESGDWGKEAWQKFRQVWAELPCTRFVKYGNLKG
jgi:sugar phosphate isomerase/epimerase